MNLRLLAPFRLVALLLCVSTSLAAATGVPVGSVRVPEGLSEAKVRAIVAETFVARSWTVERVGDDIVGRLVHRGYDATVTAVQRDGLVNLYSDSWKTNRNGERVKREQPKGWIDNLRKDLPKRLARAAVALVD